MTARLFIDPARLKRLSEEIGHPCFPDYAGTVRIRTAALWPDGSPLYLYISSGGYVNDSGDLLAYLEDHCQMSTLYIRYSSVRPILASHKLRMLADRSITGGKLGSRPAERLAAIAAGLIEVAELSNRLHQKKAA